MKRRRMSEESMRAEAQKKIAVVEAQRTHWDAVLGTVSGFCMGIGTAALAGISVLQQAGLKELVWPTWIIAWGALVLLGIVVAFGYNKSRGMLELERAIIRGKRNPSWTEIERKLD